jgi:hypothetical protein
LSAYTEIFVASDDDMAAVAAVVGAVLGSDFTPTEGDYWTAVHDHAAYDLEVNDFETDRDLNFDDFTWLIAVRDLDRDLERQQVLARQLFDKLATATSWPMMLTHDLQRLLARR